MSKTLSLAALALLAGTSIAGASELALTFSGSAYEGGPAFEVKVGGSVIGTGVVDPVPPAGQGYEYTFALPEPLPGASEDLSIRLTNDIFKGSGKDRNLFLLAARIDQTPIPLTSFALMNGGQPFQRKLRGGRLELWSGKELAILPLAPGAAPTDIVVAAPPAPAADSDATRVAEVAPASVAAPVTCSASAAVVGIQTVSKPLSKAQLAVLNDVMAQAKAGACGIVLKGYASQGGSAEGNKKASTARAQLVLDTLKKKGLSFASEKVVGAGATNQFGSDDASNQRVSVALVASGKK